METPSDPWQSLPTEQAAEIVKNITDIRDITNFAKTSLRFRELAEAFTEQLTSTNLIQIPADFLSLFPQLESVDHKIVILVNENNLPVIRELVRLRKAH